MTLTVQAVYENGILKPDQPLPLREHEPVQVTIVRRPSLAEQCYGLIGWKGDVETFDRILTEAKEVEQIP